MTAPFGKQKNTYLVYSRGLLPEDLKLGSLYLDPANPLDGERKRFEATLTQSELDKWTRSPEIDSLFNLSFTASRQWIIASGILSLLEGEVALGKSHEVKISGTSGTRLQIKNPETFLNEVVLGSKAARAWLATQLSISRYMDHISKGLGRGPRIWLVTGVQRVKDASIVVSGAQHKKLAFSATAPVPEPIAAAVTIVTGGGGLASGAAENETARDTTTLYHHDDERVWAAQFTQLSVKFSSKKEASDVVLPGWIPLHDLPDIKVGAVRADDGLAGVVLDEEAAEVSISSIEDGGVEGDDLLLLMHDVDWNKLESLGGMA